MDTAQIVKEISRASVILDTKGNAVKETSMNVPLCRVKITGLVRIGPGTSSVDAVSIGQVHTVTKT